jgi:hypothetical protein
VAEQQEGGLTMITRKLLAAMSAEELIDLAMGCADPDTGEAFDDEDVALLDCEWLRRFGPNDGIRDTWEGREVPSSVLELKPLLDQNNVDLEKQKKQDQRVRQSVHKLLNDVCPHGYSITRTRFGDFF